MNCKAICTMRLPVNGRARGFTYIAVLIFIAIMSVALAAAGEVMLLQLKRDREEELLFAGHQIRDAIAAYTRQGPGYPASLEDLVKDPRFPATRRYLRKLYPDPAASTAMWALVKGPNGEIMGVHSSSDDEPVKKAGFDLADRVFEGKTKYSDWLFVISPVLVPGPANLQKQPGTVFSGAPGVAKSR